MKNKSNTSLLHIGLAAVALAVSHGQATTLFDPVVEWQKPGISDMSFSSGEGFGMSIQGEPGIYPVQVSENLSDWRFLKDVVVGSGPERLVDAESAGLDRRFYRAAGNELSHYHFVMPFAGVETSSGSGRLVSGFRKMDTTLSIGGGGEAALHFFNERMAGTEAAPPNRALRAFRGEGLAFGVVGEMTSSGFDWQFPQTSGTDPFGREQTVEAFSLPMAAIEADRTTFAGIATRDYQAAGAAGNGIVLGMMTRKSENASLDALEGEWGFVRWLQKSYSWGVRYNMAAYASSIHPQDNEMEFTYVRDVEMAHDGTGGYLDVNLDHGDEAFSERGAISVAPDGTFELFGGSIRGFFSTSGDFFAAAFVSPTLLYDLEPGEKVEDEATSEDERDFDSEYFVGVRRDTSPQLGGRTYRILGQGTIVAGGKFEIFSS